ncbi:threonine/homoserine efflux transporter RhtA [Seonamhaeicola aphaedonensis]|uniref:Threonine/homoserine efflux transporter RhtA n=2 Tax=Seonamhaeicola aphaedonensis TaxID=1461338 RepID=A0A3D9HIM8_9FLAO|nr:threonine/homoserine efflux transporter RhtA [Seonamhaeicola aphaedonensis]
MLISTLSFACMNSIVKYLVHFSAYQIVFFRSVSTLAFTMVFLLRNRIPILGNNKKILVLRGLVGVTSMTLFFMSTKYLPIGTAVSLRYLAPIFAAIFAILFLKETVKPMQWLFFLMAFSGVVILKGFDMELNSYGLMLILISAIFSGLVYVVLSKIGKSEHPVVVVNYFMAVSTLAGGFLSIGSWVNPIGVEWSLLLGLGVFGYFGQVYMTKAFQTVSSTSQIAPLKYMETIFTLLLGILVFAEVYTFWSLLGISLIILGLVLNTQFREKLRS